MQFSRRARNAVRGGSCRGDMHDGLRHHVVPRA
jgi:hypothetical protein